MNVISNMDSPTSGLELSNNFFHSKVFAFWDLFFLNWSISIEVLYTSTAPTIKLFQMFMFYQMLFFSHTKIVRGLFLFNSKIICKIYGYFKACYRFKMYALSFSNYECLLYMFTLYRNRSRLSIYYIINILGTVL